MKRQHCVISVCLAVACALLGYPADAARKREKTIKDLQARPVVINPNQKVEASSDRAMQSYKRFLELQNTDPKLRAEALRRLGDLNLEAGEVERMASEVNAIDLQGAEAIKLYTTLLKAYPDYPRNDQVLYQLARAYETTGQPEKALATLDELVKRYPRAPQIDEVHFRRGELLFSAKNYPGAEAAYAAVMQRGGASTFYEESLYKHGWSLFKRGLNDESLPSFMGVLDQVLLDKGNSDKLRPVDSLTRPERELVEDTLRVVSITFSYLDGATSVSQFLAARGDPPYSHLLYSRLGDLFVEKERFQDGAAAYRAFVARDPNNEFSPVLATQAIEAYDKGGLANLVLDGKREFVERYDFESAFWQGRDRAANTAITDALSKNMKDVATYYHATAQASKKPADYAEAARWYRRYLKSFPDAAGSAATNLLLAETLFESQNYVEAATEFERTAYEYPRNEASAKAAYSSLVAYDRQEQRLAPEAKPAWRTRTIDAGIKFASTFPEHPDSGGVLTRAAEQVFAANDLPRAIELAEQVLARQPPVDAPKQRIAWTIIGQASFDQGQFDKAEKAYLQARNIAATDPKMRNDLTERIAQSVYRQAEAKQKAGDGNGAAEDFLRVAALSPDSKIRATAEYDAAAQFINLKNWPRAIQVLEAYRLNYPKSEFAADVTRKLAVAYAESGRAAQAAVEFEKIASNRSEDAAVRREATLQAAELFDKGGDSMKAMWMLERFVANYPTPLADAIEARQKLADIAGKVNFRTRRDNLLAEIVRLDATAGAARTDRTKFLAANAQLTMAEPARDRFRAVRLVAPLPQSLAKKRQALDAALAAYKKAADYRIASVSTASTFEVAELYRTLGQDIMKSQRPKGLSADEREAYDSLLEEQAFPFEEQAIATHEVNVGRAREGIFDDSVRKSYATLAQLKAGRYGKSEFVAEPFARPSVGSNAKAPERAEADFARALGLLRGGDANQAAIEFQLVSQAYPDLVAPYFNLGIAQRRAGRYADAVTALTSAAERAPNDAIVFTQLGLAQREQGMFREARASYERALAVDPNYAPAHRNLGVVLDLYLGEPEPALAAFEKYKSLSNEDKPVSGWIAELRQRLGKNERPPAAPESEAAPTTAPEEVPPPAARRPARSGEARA
jgi:tetratricopeptide (TPR) repeat protein